MINVNSSLCISDYVPNVNSFMQIFITCEKWIRIKWGPTIRLMSHIVHTCIWIISFKKIGRRLQQEALSSFRSTLYTKNKKRKDILLRYIFLYFKCHFICQKNENVDFSKLQHFDLLEHCYFLLCSCTCSTAIKSMPQKGIKEIECGRIFTASFVRFMFFRTPVNTI